MAYSYQCGHRHCRQRRSYPKPLEAYKRRPRGVGQDGLCSSCGKGHLNPVDKHLRKWNRQLRLENHETCNCPGLRMPHTLGQEGCLYAPDVPWEADYGP